MPDSSSAIAITKGVDTLSKAGGELLVRIFGGVADEIGEYLQETVHLRLKARRAKVLERAAEAIAHAGLEAHEVPLRTLLPIMQGAAIEDDETLVERWAALLANSATEPTDVRPIYAATLSVLSPTDAKVLDRAYGIAAQQVARDSYEARYVRENLLMESFELPLKELQISLNTLISCGLIDRVTSDSMQLEEYTGIQMAEFVFSHKYGRRPDVFTLTSLGQSLVEACRMPGFREDNGI